MFGKRVSKWPSALESKNKITKQDCVIQICFTWCCCQRWVILQCKRLCCCVLIQCKPCGVVGADALESRGVNKSLVLLVYRLYWDPHWAHAIAIAVSAIYPLFCRSIDVFPFDFVSLSLWLYISLTMFVLTTVTLCRDLSEFCFRVATFFFYRASLICHWSSLSSALSI